MTDSMHILGSRDGGGAERFYVRLVQALNAAGHVALAVHPRDAWSARQLGAAVPHAEIAMRGVWDLASRWRIGQLMRRERPPIVQTYMGRATRLTHIRPGQGTVHVARLGGYYNLKGYRHAHAWVGNTQGICDYLVREGLPAGRVHHIGNFLDVPARIDDAEKCALREHYGIPAEAWLIFALGRLHANKGFPDLLDAFARLPAEITQRPVHLLIAGDGPLRDDLHRQAETAGLGERLHWAGWIDDPTACFQSADLFVCPSRHEPLGNVILEAWANGVPVISTRSLGAEEIMTDGEDGRLVPLENPAALAQCMEDVLAGDDAERRRIAENGQQLVATRHSRAAIVGQYLDLYRALRG